MNVMKAIPFLSLSATTGHCFKGNCTSFPRSIINQTDLHIFLGQSASFALPWRRMQTGG
jgi:hypothetical protein